MLETSSTKNHDDDNAIQHSSPKPSVHTPQTHPAPVSSPSRSPTVQHDADHDDTDHRSSPPAPSLYKIRSYSWNPPPYNVGSPSKPFASPLIGPLESSVMISPQSFGRYPVPNSDRVKTIFLTGYLPGEPTPPPSPTTAVAKKAEVENDFIAYQAWLREEIALRRRGMYNIERRKIEQAYNRGAITRDEGWKQVNAALEWLKEEDIAYLEEQADAVEGGVVFHDETKRFQGLIKPHEFEAFSADDGWWRDSTEVVKMVGKLRVPKSMRMTITESDRRGYDRENLKRWYLGWPLLQGSESELEGGVDGEEAEQRTEG